MGKHTDKLGTIEDFRAPWETEAGDDAEVDKPKLRRLIFNLKNGEAKALDSQEETKGTLSDLETELATTKKSLADANGDEAQKTIDKLEKKVADLTTERDKFIADKAEADLRADVIGDLDPKYAKYVKGATQEELEKSLEDVKKDFGLEDGDGDEDEDDDEPKVRTRPRANLKNGADPEGGKGGGGEIDYDKAADEILGNNIWS